MRQYYFFITSLKDISLDSTRLPIGQQEFISSLMDVIDPKDVFIFNALRYHFDNINLVNILEKKDNWTQFGIHSREDLTEQSKDPVNLPSYMKNFLESIRYEERLFPKLSLIDELTYRYCKYLQELPVPFLGEFVRFDMGIKNVAAAISCRKYNINAQENILLLDEHSESLIQSNASDFGLIHDYEWLGEMLEAYENKTLVQREMTLAQMRFRFIEEKLLYDYFSINRIIGYYIKLFILERIIGWNEPKGREIFENLTDRLSVDENIFTGLN